MYQQKLEYMIQVNRQIQNGLLALDRTTRKDRKDRVKEETFSSLYNTINTLNAADNIEFALKDFHITDYSHSDFEVMLDPDYQFFENFQLFSMEFKAVLLFFASAGKDEDPRADLLAMKALFAAGKMVAKLEGEGYVRSDGPKMAGSTPKKKTVPYQDVIEAAYRIDTKGLKSKRAISEAVREHLLHQESKKPKPRNVYSSDHIRKEILKEEWSKIL